MTDTTYNGWKNRETWNVALWIQNDQGLYDIAQACSSYKEFANAMREFGQTETPDQISYSDSGLDIESLNEVIEEL
jgi:hypothetical protein